ncbi:MAG: hypothetical protein EOS31_13695 [Mesorhizobium sp.]|nr:hypothetical protein EOA37_30600 [Mesorhizobium sp. M2A.F.Ca.ET.015.02.1.1]RVC91402.1 hypothetical protein EN739_29865 [Mesorhizobium sp. M2A.F.Ca.ET.017.03.2.1]RVC96702.1 hypothetical protein EN753_30910 [Mesorhizobium sp. M2A.F.Ca.ET.029.05.1.1]RWC81276.1 MAG: hypothetical protein EOS31_21350 [Mesorhizobium sp.]RWC82841.1 MAG: hypothetical protein EOS31_13695 [Mesorhizobium sp.]
MIARFGELMTPQIRPIRPIRSDTLDTLCELVAARRALVKDRAAALNRQKGRACSGCTRVTARWIARPPLATLGTRTSIRPIARPNRSSVTRPIDNSLGGSFLHW